MVVINARCKADPEVLAHTLVEEFVHAQQRLNGVDFEAQRRQYAYRERPYEQEAKRIATETLGYEPDEFDTHLVREEPTGVLYDQRAT